MLVNSQILELLIVLFLFYNVRVYLKIFHGIIANFSAVFNDSCLSSIHVYLTHLNINHTLISCSR